MLCFKFLLSIFGLKNTLWDVTIEMSAECYLIVVYILPCCVEFLIFLNFCLWDACVLNTQIVNSVRAGSYVFGEDFRVKA